MYLDNFDSGFGICKTDPHEQLTNLEFYLSFHRNICIPIYIFRKSFLTLISVSYQILHLYKNLNTKVLRLDGYGIQKWILFSKSRSFLGGKLLLFIIMSDIDFPGYYAYQMISKSSSLSVSHCGEIIFEGEIFYSHNCFQEYFILKFSDMTI